MNASLGLFSFASLAFDHHMLTSVGSYAEEIDMLWIKPKDLCFGKQCQAQTRMQQFVGI